MSSPDFNADAELFGHPNDKLREPGKLGKLAAYLVVTLILAAFNSASSGQTVDLLCWERVRGEKKGEPLPARVDLDGKRISTPVGEFKISSISDNMVVFDGDDSENKVEGFFHRFEGWMDIFWMRPNQLAYRGAFYLCELRKRLL